MNNNWWYKLKDMKALKWWTSFCDCTALSSRTQFQCSAQILKPNQELMDFMRQGRCQMVVKYGVLEFWFALWELFD